MGSEMCIRDSYSGPPASLILGVNLLFFLGQRKLIEKNLVRIAMRPIAHRELSSTVRVLFLQSQCRCSRFKSLTKPTRKKNRRSKIIGQPTKPKLFLVTLGCSNIGLFDGAFGCRLVGLFQQPKFNFGSDRPGNSNNESS